MDRTFSAMPVKLRDHPLMSYRGIPNWPPVWTQMRIGGVKIVKGEVGVLIYVHAVSYTHLTLPTIYSV